MLPTVITILSFALLIVIPLLTEWGYFVRGRNWKDYFGPNSPEGHTKNSIFWGLVMGAITFAHLMLAYEMPWAEAGLLALQVAFMAFATNAWIGHSAHQAAFVWFDKPPGDGNWTEWPTFWLPYVVKRTKSTLSLYNWIGMTTIGVVRSAMIAAPLAYWVDPLWTLLALAGALHPVAYWCGTETAPQDPLPACEAKWGGLFGACFSVTAIIALAF